MAEIIQTVEISLPELALVVLVGPTGAGKSTFARRHFRPTEIVSSDACRGLVADDENDQSASGDAFDLLHFIVKKRLTRGLLTVVDATNVQVRARKPLVALAREHHVLPVAVVFDIPFEVCLARNAARDDRNFGPHVVHHHIRDLRRSLKALKGEGFRHIHRFDDVAALDAASMVRAPLWNNKRAERGPFDIIGDVHGCGVELHALLAKLGYTIRDHGRRYTVTPPPGRKAIFLGDLVDRGPDSVGVLQLVMDMVDAGVALCVPGNHDVRCCRALLKGQDPSTVDNRHGLRDTLKAIAAEPEAFKRRVVAFIDGLVSHYVLDRGELVVAHAGMKAAYQGRTSGTVRQFALYGETSGEVDAYGLPVRLNWAADYRGRALVVYGHTPVVEPEWLNNTLCIDTGCVFGGKLTALRYPEREWVAVEAHRCYWTPQRPLAAPSFPKAAEPVDPRSLQQRADDDLDLDDLLLGPFAAGERSVNPPIEQRLAALEVLSRFAVDPRWLTYLPPTMAAPEPGDPADHPHDLERPEPIFEAYRRQGVEALLCQEKHMGSRAVVQLCRYPQVAQERFGLPEPAMGMVYTRSGRRFFSAAALEAEFLAHLARAAEAAGLWQRLESDWLTLDGELMPWSFKALALVRDQYAAVGAAGEAATTAALETLELAGARGVAVADLRAAIARRRDHLAAYRQAYRRYCREACDLDQLRFAPFHLLASEGALHADRDHRWHLERLAELAAAGAPVVVATPHRSVDLADLESCAKATAWWGELVAAGGEGMVIKPLAFRQRGRRGWVQPAVKCRGRDYLRIIYGPDYPEPQHLQRLRRRSGGVKRRLALQEFALGLEALANFVHRQPLRTVHRPILGILALESEPVDPRL